MAEKKMAASARHINLRYLLCHAWRSSCCSPRDDDFGFDWRSSAILPDDADAADCAGLADVRGT